MDYSAGMKATESTTCRELSAHQSNQGSRQKVPKGVPVAMDYGMENITVAMNMQTSGDGLFVGELIMRCKCGDWEDVQAMSPWTTMFTITQPTREHLIDCKVTTCQKDNESYPFGHCTRSAGHGGVHVY